MALLSKEEQLQVAEAIRQVEAGTEAEVVTVLAARADDYHYIPLLWAALLSLLLPGLIAYYTALFSTQQLILLQWSGFCVSALLLRLPFLRILLVPRSVRYWRASNLARRHFLEQNLHHTQADSGVLIFVSEAERYVEILVDRGVSAHIADSVWQEAVSRFSVRLHKGQVLEGFLECLGYCEEQLCEALPVKQQKNELPNHLVIVD